MLGLPEDLVRRVGITVVAALAIVALDFAPVPGMFIPEASFYGLPRHPLAIGALGIVPFACGFVLVELVAMVWPGAPGSRPFGRERPSSLGRIAAITGLGLAVLQAGVAAWYWFGVIPDQIGGMTGGMSEAGLVAPVVAVSSLVAGAGAHALAALWVREQGLGDGFAVVIGVEIARRAAPASEKFEDWLRGMNLHNLDVFAVLGNVLAVSAAVLGTLWMLLRLEEWVAGREPESATEGPDRSARTPYHTPTAGIVPFVVGSGGLWAFWSVRTFLTESPVTWLREGIGGISYGGVFPYFLQELAVVVGLALVAVWLFGNVDAGYATRTDGDSQSTLRRAQGASVLFVAGLVVLDVYGGPLLRAFGVVNVVLLTAIAGDLVREWRFRRAFPDACRIASLHRTGAGGPVLERLAQEDVPALARARGFRGLLRWLGAFTAVEIFVPESCRNSAEAAVEDAVGES